MHFHVCGLNSLNSPSVKSVRHSFTSFKSEDMPVNQICKEYQVLSNCQDMKLLWPKQRRKESNDHDHQIFCHSWLAWLKTRCLWCPATLTSCTEKLGRIPVVHAGHLPSALSPSEWCRRHTDLQNVCFERCTVAPLWLTILVFRRLRWSFNTNTPLAERQVYFLINIFLSKTFVWINEIPKCYLNRSEVSGSISPGLSHRVAVAGTALTILLPEFSLLCTFSEETPHQSIWYPVSSKESPWCSWKAQHAQLEIDEQLHS